MSVLRETLGEQFERHYGPDAQQARRDNRELQSEFKRLDARIAELETALTGMADAYVALLLMKAEDPTRFQEPGSPYANAKAALAKANPTEGGV